MKFAYAWTSGEAPGAAGKANPGLAAPAGLACGIRIGPPHLNGFDPPDSGTAHEAPGFDR